MPSIEDEVPQKALDTLVLEKRSLVVNHEERIESLKSLTFHLGFDGVEVLHGELCEYLLLVVVSEDGVTHRRHRILGDDEPDVVEDLAIDLVGSLGGQETDEVRGFASPCGAENAPEEVTTRARLRDVLTERRVAQHLGGDDSKRIRCFVNHIVVPELLNCITISSLDAGI